jgi:hypothetical protein
MKGAKMKRVLLVLALVFVPVAAIVIYKIIHKPQDSREAWIAILSKCAKSQLIGKDVLYFGASNEIGPGSIWRQNSDGSIRLRYELSDLVPDNAKRTALIRPNNSVSCGGDSASSWEVQLGLPFDGTVAPVSADVSADLKRADGVTVSVTGYAVDELKEGPYETMIRADDALQDEFTAPDRVIVENAVRIEGFSANFKFSRSIAEQLKGKYTGQVVSLQGANLQSQWSDDTALTMKTPGTFYLLAAFGKLTGTPNKAGFSAVKAGAKPPSLLSERTSALGDMQIRAAALESIQAAQKVRGAGIDKPAEEVAVVAPTATGAAKRTFPNIVVTNGEIVLKGAVKDPAIRNQFMMDVQRAPGARRVTNEIVAK